MPKMERKRCPECGVAVRIDRIEGHVARLHPKADRKTLLTEVERREIVRDSKKSTRSKPITKKEAGLFFTGVIVIVVIVMFLALQQPGGLKVHDKAPDFTLKDTKGSTFCLGDHKGRVVLLNLMDAKCGYCQRDTSGVLVYVYKNYSSKVIFVSVDVQIEGQGTNEEIEMFKTNTGASWIYCLDVDGHVKDEYKVGGTPTTYVVDPSGVITYIDHGSASIGELSGELDKALG
jgi:peroxiredoxin